MSISVRRDLDAYINSGSSFSEIWTTIRLCSVSPTILPPVFASLQLVNGLALQLVRHIVPMQLSHGKESRLARVPHRFASTGLHHVVALFSPNISSCALLTLPHEPASSDAEPDNQTEDDHQDDDRYGDCDGEGLSGHSFAATAAVVASTSSCCFGGRVRGRAA